MFIYSALTCWCLRANARTEAQLAETKEQLTLTCETFMGTEVGLCRAAPFQMTHKGVLPQRSVLRTLAEGDSATVVEAKIPSSVGNVCGQGGKNRVAHYPENGSDISLDNAPKNDPDNDDGTIAESPRGALGECREASVDNLGAHGAPFWRNELKSGNFPLELSRRERINNDIGEENNNGGGGSDEPQPLQSPSNTMVLQVDPELRETGDATPKSNGEGNRFDKSRQAEGGAMDHEARQVNATLVVMGDTSRGMIESDGIVVENSLVASNTPNVVGVVMSDSTHHTQDTGRGRGGVDITIGHREGASCDAGLGDNGEKQEISVDEHLPGLDPDASIYPSSSIATQQGPSANMALQTETIEVDGREETGETDEEVIPWCRLPSDVVVLPTAVVRTSEIVGPTLSPPDSTRPGAPPAANRGDCAGSGSPYYFEPEFSTFTSSPTSITLPVPSRVYVANTAPSPRETIPANTTESSGSAVTCLNECDGNASGIFTPQDGLEDEDITATQGEGFDEPAGRGNDEARAGDMGEAEMEEHEQEENLNDASSNEPQAGENRLERGCNMGNVIEAVVLEASLTREAFADVGIICDSSGDNSAGNRETTATMAMLARPSLPPPPETTRTDTASPNDAEGDAELIGSTAFTDNQTLGDDGDGIHLPTPFANRSPPNLTAAKVETTETERGGTGEAAEGEPSATIPSSLASGGPGLKTESEAEHNDAGRKGRVLGLQEVVLTPRPPSPVSVTKLTASGNEKAEFDVAAAIADDFAAFLEAPPVAGDDAVSMLKSGDLRTPPAPSVIKCLPPKITTAIAVVEKTAEGDLREAQGRGGGGLVGRMNSFGSTWGRKTPRASLSPAAQGKNHARSGDSITSSSGGDVRGGGLRRRLRSFGAGKSMSKGSNSMRETDSDRVSSANTSGTVSPAASSPVAAAAAGAVYSPRGKIERVASWASSRSVRGEVDGADGRGVLKKRRSSFRLALRKPTAKISPKNMTSNARVTSPSGINLGAGLHTPSLAVSPAVSPESSPLAASNNRRPQGEGRRESSRASSNAAGGDVTIEERDTSYRWRQVNSSSSPSLSSTGQEPTGAVEGQPQRDGELIETRGSSRFSRAWRTVPSSSPVAHDTRASGDVVHISPSNSSPETRGITSRGDDEPQVRVAHAMAPVPSEKTDTIIRGRELDDGQEQEPRQQIGSLAAVPAVEQHSPAANMSLSFSVASGDVDRKGGDGIHADLKEEQPQSGASARQHRRGRSSGLLSALRNKGSKKNERLRSESPLARGRKDDEGAK